MNRYDRNKGHPGKKPNWLIRYRSPTWPTDVYEKSRGSERADKAYMAELRRQMKVGTWVHPSQRSAEASFKVYAIKVIDGRRDAGVKSADKDERGHVVNHLIPAFGDMLVRDLGFSVIKRGFQGDPSDSDEVAATRINHKGLSGRMIRNIHSTLRAILVQAEEDGLIAELPPPLTVKRRHLPPPVDKDPNWRNQAVYDLREIRMFAQAEHIPSYRKVPLLTYFLTGSRFIEIVPLTVRDLIERQPLNCLAVKAVKIAHDRTAGERRREVPVPGDLQAWLDWWLDVEYRVIFGHAPGLDDLLFPTPSVRRRNKGHEMISHNEFYKQFVRNDLPPLGIRPRSLHPARRTFLSLLKNAGVDSETRRKITHWSVEDRVLDGYTIVEWKLLCTAVSQVNWRLPDPRVNAAAAPEANVVRLHQPRR